MNTICYKLTAENEANILAEVRILHFTSCSNHTLSPPLTCPHPHTPTLPHHTPSPFPPTHTLPPLSGDFMKDGEAGVYEDILKFPDLKKLMEEKLEDYNMEPGIIPMGLVLFKDAIEHGQSPWHHYHP